MPYQKNGVRQYKEEYEKYHKKPSQRKNNNARKRARYELEKEGKVSKGDGKDVHHKNPLIKGGGNGKKNLAVVNKSTNRSVAKTSGNRMKGKG